MQNSGSGGPPSVTTVGSLIALDTTDFLVGPGSIVRAAGPADSSYVPTGWAIDPTADGSLSGGRAGFTIQWWYQPAQTTLFHYLGGDPAFVVGLGQRFRILVGPQAGPGGVLVLGPFNQLATSNNVLTSSVNAAGWLHLALVYDHAPGLLTWYVNGVQDTQVTTTISGVGVDLGFCGYAGTSSDGPEGRMDDLRLYDFARPAVDIAADFTIQASGMGPSGESNVPTQGYYEFHHVPVSPSYQLNSTDLAVSVDGVQATEQTPALVVGNIVSCATPSAQALSLAISSSQVTQSFEMAISAANVVAANAGGATISAGTILNLDLNAPLSWLNGGLVPSLLPMTAMTFPGATSVSILVSVQPQTSLSVSIQGLLTLPSAPIGVVLSQATQLDVIVASTQAVLPGPTGDDTSMAFDVTTSPSCWTTSGVPFFGTTYTTIHVSSNGRVLFGGPENGTLPSVSSAMTGLPFVGFWSDLNPGLGGSVGASSPSPDIVRIEWAAIPYSGLALTATSFSIEIDALTGVILLDGLLGITANPGFTNAGDNQFLGITHGAPGSATDLGPTVFAIGAMGTAVAPEVMLYDFYDFNVFGGLVGSLTPGTLDRITFTPSTSVPPGYDWSGS